jgi:aminoglycoside phosphotransferase
MHKAVLAKLKKGGPGISVARLMSGRRCSIVAGFSPAGAAPQWVAKWSADPDGISAVRKEYEALSYLAEWTEPLGIPRVLEWEDTGGEVCLIQAGAEGNAAFASLRADRPSPVPGFFHLAVEWSARFQKLVPLRAPAAIARVAQETANRLEAQSGYGGLFKEILGILRDAGAAADDDAVPTHGDFWAMNVLLSGRRVNVVDWDHFGPGFPLEDLFSFVIYQGYVTGNRYCTITESFVHGVFSDSPVCRFVKSQIENRYGLAQARLYFYGFLARRICQTNTPADEWRTLFDWLARAGYPAPCTRIS